MAFGGSGGGASGGTNGTVEAPSSYRDFGDGSRVYYFTAVFDGNGDWDAKVTGLHGHITRIAAWPNGTVASAIDLTITSQNSIPYTVEVDIVNGERSILIPPDLFSGGEDNTGATAEIGAFALAANTVAGNAADKFYVEIWVCNEACNVRNPMFRFRGRDGVIDTGATAKDLIDAPGTGIERYELTGHLHNADSVAQVITIRFTDTSSDRNIFKESVPADSTVDLNALLKGYCLRETTDSIEALLVGAHTTTAPSFVCNWKEKAKV